MIGQTANHFQQAPLARGLEEGDSGFNQMTGAVKFMTLRKIALAFFGCFYRKVSIEIAIFALGGGDQFNHLVSSFFQFGIRLLAVLPCTLLLGNASLDKSRALLSLSLGGGGRGRAVSYGSAYWYRFGICCVCLLFAALLELWLVPQFLLLAAS